MAASASTDPIDSVEEKPLTLDAVIGFNGRVPGGLICHPDGEHVIFPLGCTIVIRNTVKNTQAFLQGHTDRVTCLALSKDGKYLASGQVTSMGFRAPVLLWDVAQAIKNGNSADRSGELLQTLKLHKVMVRDVSFNCDGRFLASLGGEDDNTIVVWDLESGEPLCGAPAAAHAALTVRWLHGEPLVFVSGGQYNLRKWKLDLDRRRIEFSDFVLGTIRRSINCVCLDPSDRFLWAGTASGDVLEVNVESERFARASKNRFSQGVLSLEFAEGTGSDDFVICGNGDGTVVLLTTATLAISSAAKLLGGVTSVARDADGTTVHLGTKECNRYVASLTEDKFTPRLRATAHPQPITSVAFPARSSELFLTTSKSEIRLWNAYTRKELLRVQVPGLQCHCVKVNPDGTLLLSGWEDGKVRAFTPQTGKLAYVINDAHVDGVTALAPTLDGKKLVTGGADGRVRVWDVSGPVPAMVVSWKEHKRPVTDVQVSKDSDEAVTSSADGSCIVWNLKRSVRQNALFASTVFRAVQYHPDESQLLTCGSDRKLGYWDTVDCSPIRQLDGSTAEIRCIDVDRKGLSFVAGGHDKMVRVWLYDEGIPVAVGAGHSNAVSAAAISPDGTTIVSAGDDGAIMLWKYPELPSWAGAYDEEEGEPGDEEKGED